MLSGIGPAEHLAQHNIPVVHDLPGVGSHLVDHPVADFRYIDKNPTLSFLQNVTISQRLQIFKCLFEYLRTGRGPLTHNVRDRLPCKV